ncbi:hypothetical protein BGZ60DRAFT_166997 [Tricladium varicosporioides]|nr:hypothetical protein BGZ60DRAFT_166997 [Hymenoscyphus varicosporioides]
MRFIGLVRRALGLRDSTVVPAICYNSYNAYIEAQKLGKSPALCAVNSTFQLNYANCTQCITANSNSTVQSLQSYINPQFESIISFCTTSSVTNSSSSPEQQSLASSLASQASYFSSVLSQASSLGYLKPSTTTQLLTVIQTPNTFTSAQISSPTQTSLPIVPAKPTNKAWIAGAVIAPLLLLVAILFAAYYLWRRKRTTMRGGQEAGVEEKKEGGLVDEVYKAQLHGESMPRHELDADQTSERRVISELPALEVVGSELDTKTLDKIRRKPVNQPPAA